MARSLTPLRSSLRWRLIAATSGIVLLCTAVCIVGAVLFLRQALTDRARADMRNSLQGVTGFLDDQRADLLGMAELVAADPGVQADILRHDQRALTVHLTHYFADINNADVLDVVDAQGRMLVRMEDTLSAGDSVARWPSVRAALTDRETVAYGMDPAERQAGGYALRATVPLHSGDRVIGAVVVGRQLRDEFAARIGHAVDVDVNLIAGGAITGSTLRDSSGLPLNEPRVAAATLRRIDGGPTISITSSAGHAALSGMVPLAGADGQPAGAVELIAPLGSLYDVITRLSFLLLALGALAVLAGSMLALGMGRRLTARLLSLESVAAQAAERANADVALGDLGTGMTVQGDDEVASLARSFTLMMAALDARMHANTRLYAAAQERVRELSGLAEIARLLTAGASLRGTLDTLCEQVCRLAGCSAVAIVLPPESSTDSASHGGFGLPEDFAAQANATQAPDPSGDFEGAAQAALRTGRVVWLRTSAIPPSHEALRRNAERMGWGGATAVPLRLQERTVGALACFTTAAEPLSPSDLGLLCTIADQVAVAVENARLHARARDVAALEERARLARELHDSVTQALFSMTLHARAAQLALARAGPDADGPVGRSVRQLHELTQGALAEMRALIFELRPGALAEEGLAEALRKHAAALSAREGLAIEVCAPEERLALAPDVEEQLYRVAQEALHNTIKHAGASSIALRIEVTDEGPGAVIMSIRDDGCGFEPGIAQPGHLGLSTMRERIAQVHGALALISAPDQGTTVRVTVPRAGSCQESENY